MYYYRSKLLLTLTLVQLALRLSRLRRIRRLFFIDVLVEVLLQESALEKRIVHRILPISLSRLLNYNLPKSFFTNKVLY